MITYFKSINETDRPFYVDVDVAIERIKFGKSKDIVKKIRSAETKEERNNIKKQLPSILFSGEFSRRADNAIINHSGLICIDFDGFKDDEELQKMRMHLFNDKYTYCLFISPSGDGLKVLVRIPSDALNHKNYFLALEKYYDCPQFDKSCKNVSRVCYESYDPDIYVNELSEVWTEMMRINNNVKVSPTIIINDSNEIVRRLSLWWNKNYGMVKGQRNNNLFIFASALNQYGINKDDALNVLMSYDDGDMASEIKTIVWSAYKNTSEYATKFYEDIDKKTDIKNKILKGVPIHEIKDNFNDVDEDIINEMVETEEYNTFWSKSSKGKIDLVPHLFRDYLKGNGFYKYYPSGSNNFVFVRVVDNIISDTNEDMIKDFVLDYLMGINDMSVYNFFAMNTKFFQETFLNYVPKVEPRFMVDTIDESYLYFKNCAVKVTSDNIKMIDYKNLGGYVWEKQKINRDFVKIKSDDCEFKRFVQNISGNNSRRFESMESTIGYLLHSYKPASYCPAVILNDEVISDNPEGGTGKGIFVKSISFIKKMVIIDGKGFSFQKSFPYQRVQVDTQTLVFDDVSKNFDFERLFSVITEGITLEKKNKDEIHIPFESSPKIVITTNYAIKGAGNSFERRKWDLEFKQYYSKSFTPESEFGHMLFSGWDDLEWSRFDNYMIKNLQLYLSKGLIKCDFMNLKTRKFIAETSAEFWEWATSKDNDFVKLKQISIGQNMYNKFTEEYPDYGIYGRFKLSHNRFYKWLDALGEYKFGMKPKIFRSATGKTIEFIEYVNELKF
jgi:hypothetical protein